VFASLIMSLSLLASSSHGDLSLLKSRLAFQYREKRCRHARNDSTIFVTDLTRSWLTSRAICKWSRNAGVEKQTQTYPAIDQKSEQFHAPRLTFAQGLHALVRLIWWPGQL
jgi:hypothetical protein